VDLNDLLTGYNQLAALVAPATSESLWLKSKVEAAERQAIMDDPKVPPHRKVHSQYLSLIRSMLLVGVVTFLTQGYVSFISDVLARNTELDTEYAFVIKQIEALKLAKNTGASNEIKMVDIPKEIRQKMYVLDMEYNLNYCLLKNINLKLWFIDSEWWNEPKQEYEIKPIQCNAQPKALQEDDTAVDQYLIDNSADTAVRTNYFTAKKATLRIINYLLLPTLVGALGALAHVLRQILSNYKQTSYLIGFQGKWAMRIVLGSALGFISGMLVVPELKALEKFSASPLVWGFISGYSVEFAFSVFDWWIEKGREIVKIDKKPELPGKAEPSSKEPPKIVLLSPAAGKEGDRVLIVGSGFSASCKVSFGEVPAKWLEYVSAECLRVEVPLLAAHDTSVDVIISVDNMLSVAGEQTKFMYR
jgi:hypothetical protein